VRSFLSVLHYPTLITNPTIMTNTENGAVPALNQLWRPRRGLRRVDAAYYIGVSPSKFDQLVTDGRMPAPIKLDGCTVWDMRQLDRAFDVLAEETEDANPWSQVTLQ
jgi:predicted DNA-binding transcriptional regulator AlpA